jgi:predicted RNA-binding Zn-ribbon protein involved in translation (DUF1610 family)
MKPQKSNIQTLNQLAQSYFAFEKSDISDFQKKARLLQSMWREEKGYEAGVLGNRKLGNLLAMPWAKETLNNYLTDKIKKVLTQELLACDETEKLYGKPRIYNNLLSSQPLCFNLFAELKLDLELATKVFKKLTSGRIEKVTAIEFEYSPGRKDISYTGDRSAFDVYVEYTNNSNEKGFVGIEVKYHENLLNKAAEIKDRYFEISSMMNCFKQTGLDRIQQQPLEQIWRDHLLAGSLLYSTKDNFKDGFFVFLYPQDNLHCRDAVEQYKQCLIDDKTFQSWTLEDVAGVIKQNTKDSWIDELIDRYLNFQKITKPKECPKCGKKKIAEYLYGMPAYTESMQKDIDAGKIILGGCMVSDDNPQYKCQACGYEW